MSHDKTVRLTAIDELAQATEGGVTFCKVDVDEVEASACLQNVLLCREGHVTGQNTSIFLSLISIHVISL